MKIFGFVYNHVWKFCDDIIEQLVDMMKLLRFVLMACLSLVAFSCSRLDGGADVSGTPDGAAVKVDSPLMSDRFAESMVAYTVKDLRNGTVSPVKVQHSQSGMLYFPVSEDNGGAVVVAGGFPEITSSQKDGKLLVMSLGKAGVYSEFPDPNFTDICMSFPENLEMGSAVVNTLKFSPVSARVKAVMYLEDKDGNMAVKDELIDDITLVLNGAADRIDVEDDMSVSVSGDTSVEFPLVRIYKDDRISYNISAASYVPVGKSTGYTVNIKYDNGNVESIEGVFEEPFQAGMEYRLTFTLGKVDASGRFTLKSAEVEKGYYTDMPGGSVDMFDVAGNYCIGSAKGSEIRFAVKTAMPYSWNYELVEGEGLFSVSRVADSLAVTALQDGSEGGNVGLLRLVSEAGHEANVNLVQLSSQKSVVKIESSDVSKISLNLKGTGIQVDMGDGFKDYGGNGDEVIEVSLYNAVSSTVTVSADYLSYLEMDGSSNYIPPVVSFENCHALETAILFASNEVLDVSSLPSLRNLSIGYGSTVGSVKFKPGHKLVSFSYNSQQYGLMTSLDLTEVCSELRSVKVVCDKLEDVRIYPEGYSDEKKLESLEVESDAVARIDVSGCGRLVKLKLKGDVIETLMMSDCSTLGSFSVSSKMLMELEMGGCSSLRAIELYRAENLRFINIAGTDMLEYVYISGNSVDYMPDLDFSGRRNLKKVEVYAKMAFLDFSDCPSLENVEVKYVDRLDVSGTPAVKNMKLYGSDDKDMVVDAAGCGAQVVDMENVGGKVNFSQFADARRIILSDCRMESVLLDGCGRLDYANIDCNVSASSGVLAHVSVPSCLDTLFISSRYANTLLESIDGFSSAKGLKRLELSNQKSLSGLSFDGMSVLEYVDTEYIVSQKKWNLSGCTALKSFTGENDSAEYDFTGCSSLTDLSLYSNYISAVLNGCQSLENLVLRSKNVNELDLSGLPLLGYVRCADCNMDADALDAMMVTLPDRNAVGRSGKLDISGNPGADTCDRSIATAKRWIFE